MIKYLKFNGKNLPIRISYYALRQLQLIHGKGVEDVNGDYQLMEALMFYSLEWGHKQTNTEFTLTMEDMVNVMDECMNEFVAMIPEFFAQKETPATIAAKKGAAKK